MGYNHQTSEFTLTRSLAVIWINDEDADDKELHGPPRDFLEQGAAFGACAQQAVD